VFGDDRTPQAEMAAAHRLEPGPDRILGEPCEFGVIARADAERAQRVDAGFAAAAVNVLGHGSLPALRPGAGALPVVEAVIARHQHNALRTAHHHGPQPERAALALLQ